MTTSDNELYSRLGAIEAKVDQLLEAGYEKRISALERWQARITGAAAFAAFVFGFAMQAVLKAF